MIAEKKRQNIPHLSDMPAQDFITWLRSMDGKDFKPKIHHKIDGFFGRFGKDSDGQFFYQLARTPVLRDPQEVLWYALSREYIGEQLVRASKITQMMIMLRDSEIVKTMIDGSAIECDFLFKPMAEKLDENFKFVSIPYFESTCKTDLTIFAHSWTSAEDTSIHIDLDMRQFLHADSNVRVIPSEIKLENPIDISEFTQLASSLPTSDIRVLKSLNHFDRARKIQIRDWVNSIQTAFTDKILNEPQLIEKSNELGPFREGYVLHINSKQFKVVTPHYKVLRLQ